MRTANDAFKLKRTIVPTRLGLGVFDSFRTALRRWRDREELRAQLNRMTDRELDDIGTTRDDIVAANRYLLPPF